MIEQIKQALGEIKGMPWRIGLPSPNGLQNVGTKMGLMICQTFTTEDANLIANAPEWLRYLLGEVERLKQSNSNLLKQYHQRGKDNDKVIYDLVSANTELQKALEWYADEQNYTFTIKSEGYHKYHSAVQHDAGKCARQALKGSEPK